MQSSPSTNTLNESTDPRLHLCSPLFDPLLALNIQQISFIQGLDNNILPLDNLVQARRLLPVEDPDYMLPAISSTPTTTTTTNKPNKYNTPKFINPLLDIAQSFERKQKRSTAAPTGPFDLLRTSLGKRVKVLINRDRHEFGSCIGILSGFDRHWNLILDDGVETYSTYEFITVSKRSHDLRTNVARFYKDFNINPTWVGGDVDSIIQQYSSTSELWKMLHNKTPNLRQVIFDLLYQRNQATTWNDVDSLLARRAGHERVLILQLRAGNENNNNTSSLTPVSTAEWVKLPSEKHPGHFFYLNNETNTSVWEPPAGVEFRQIRSRNKIERKRPFRKMLVRGAIVMTITVLVEQNVVVPTTTTISTTSMNVLSSSSKVGG
jgi:small nuclear ribonucleoprotein (snRNP)-like protein